MTMKMMMTLLVLGMASCQEFRRVMVGKSEAVSVHDLDGKPLYGVVLAPHDSYE